MIFSHTLHFKNSKDDRAHTCVCGEAVQTKVWRTDDTEPRLFLAGRDEADRGSGMQG